MNMRICPDCRGRSYSSYSGENWECPYCGADLGHVSNERCDALKDPLKEKAPPKKLYSIKGGRILS